MDGLKKIMIVDDSPLILRNLKKILDEKYQVFIATSGAQALAFIEKREPDLLLLDYEMPEMNGEETLARIRKIETMKELPVVFLTGVTDGDTTARLNALSIAGFLPKPVVTEDLFALLEKVLANLP